MLEVLVIIPTLLVAAIFAAFRRLWQRVTGMLPRPAPVRVSANPSPRNLRIVPLPRMRAEWMQVRADALNRRR